MKYLTLTILAALSMGAFKPNLIQIPVAHPMTLYSVSGREVTFVVCDKTVAKPLTTALMCLSNLKKPVTLVFWGCYNPRKILGTSRWSQHAFGKAVDFNAIIGVPKRMVKCFEDAGFFWGGNWIKPRTDEMHFEWRN